MAFVTLEDDKGTVPNEAVLPLVRTEVVSDRAEGHARRHQRSSSTPTTLKALMVKIEVDAAAPDVVAKEWLATIS